MFLSEDPEGNVERLALYNWTSLLKDKENQINCLSIDKSFLPIGTQLIIKNLSYKVAADNNTIIYSSNPEDVVIYDHNDKLFDDLKWSTDLLNDKEIKEKTADDFYSYGNDYFVSNDYTAAIDEYSNGIKLEPQNVTLYADRAEAFLQLSQFRDALDDVDIVLKYEPGHLKAAFRRDHRIASIKQSTEQLLKHVKILASENKNGQYDYAHIINEFCEKAEIRKGPRLDHADFLFEDIEIRSVEGKGRGWIAKCDIPENTLLMVSKAFSIVYSHEVLGRSMKSNIQNNQTTCITSSLCNEELITRITQKLLAEPYHCQEVYQLYNGLNLDKTDKINEHLVNVDLIGNIVKYNSFALDNKIIIENVELSGLGLWILPSYFNNSCIDKNVAQFFIEI
ncbi:hypothetical protein C1646_668541 [Rhizophagus diaphanus]|nr:hypothetical protein C1646_668541 [Rhizophagus diaphanus] [Rhizophagus sp. MUCL 43196]